MRAEALQKYFEAEFEETHGWTEESNILNWYRFKSPLGAQP